MTHFKKGLSIFFLTLFLFSFIIQHFSQLVDESNSSMVMEPEKELEQNTLDYQCPVSSQGLFFRSSDSQELLSPKGHLVQILGGFLNNTSPPPEA